MINHFFLFVNRKHRKNKEKTRKKFKTQKNKSNVIRHKNNINKKYKKIQYFLCKITYKLFIILREKEKYTSLQVVYQL